MYYPARYKDKNVSIDTIMFNDGKRLSIQLHKVLFRGSDFDALEPVKYDSKEQLTNFTLQHNWLCDCTIECKIPLLIVSEDKESFGTLEIHLELGKPDERNAIDKEELFLTLHYKDKILIMNRKFDDFEVGLNELQNHLPKNTYIKCCFTCMFSDYSPYGQGLFGSLGCFKDFKEEYMQIKEKVDILNLWEKSIENVQEIHLCPEYEKRKKGIGYRG